MSAKSRVKLKICGNDFFVTSDDSEEYILKIGSLVDERIQKLKDESESFSASMAAMFAAMEFCDESIKSKEAADNLRVQIREYLNEASQSRAEAEELKKEVESLKAELRAKKDNPQQKAGY